jgi:hypothetical protein
LPRVLRSKPDQSKNGETAFFGWQVITGKICSRQAKFQKQLNRQIVSSLELLSCYDFFKFSRLLVKNI